MAMRETLQNLLTRVIKAGMIEWATHDQRFRSIKASAPEVRP